MAIRKIEFELQLVYIILSNNNIDMKSKYSINSFMQHANLKKKLLDLYVVHFIWAAFLER